MQADSSLEESKTVSEPPKSRPDYTLAVRRRELRFKNHHPDPRTSRYGQRLVEEILGCRMSGWLTPKLECNKKLQAIPPPREPEGGREGGPGDRLGKRESSGSGLESHRDGGGHLLPNPTLEVPITWADARTSCPLASAKVMGTSNIGLGSNWLRRNFLV